MFGPKPGRKNDKSCFVNSLLISGMEETPLTFFSYASFISEELMERRLLNKNFQNRTNRDSHISSRKDFVSDDRQQKHIAVLLPLMCSRYVFTYFRTL
jgi:hypothetical protein